MYYQVEPKFKMLFIIVSWYIFLYVKLLLSWTYHTEACTDTYDLELIYYILAIDTCEPAGLSHYLLDLHY